MNVIGVLRMVVANVSTTSAIGALPAAMPFPPPDPMLALLFVVDAASRAFDVDAKQAVIMSALVARGREGELLIVRLSERVAQAAVTAAVTGCAATAMP